jgi:hypothetical protein
VLSADMIIQGEEEDKERKKNAILICRKREKRRTEKQFQRENCK